MKKIGILTFHKSINYGSVLQCWALKNMLTNQGYDVEVIDYEPRKYNELYGWHVKGWTKFNLKAVPIIPFRKRQSKLFSDFRNNYLNLTKNQYTYKSDFRSLNKYDVIICGSDQIWNISAADADSVFFLPFHVQGKKIAYAVSINNSTYTERRADEQLRKYILDFDYISEREKSGALKIENFLEGKKKIDVCLDPTLLHTKKDFDRIASGRIIKKPYIFLYNVWSNTDGFKAAIRLSKRLNLPVYTGLMSRTVNEVCRVERMGIKIVLFYTSPSDFLSLIKNAEWIVADSFHGTVFSIIFEKKFISVNEIKKDGTLLNDERIVNILEQLNLLSRYVTYNAIDTYNLTEVIDYKTITKKRLALAQESIKKLCNAIEGGLKS